MTKRIHNAQCSREMQKGAAGIPRLAMINDIAGFGRCSTTISLPVISAMQVQVCPGPTSILSNHLAFPVYHFDDYTPHMREYLSPWKEMGLSFDGLYCGFLGSPEQFSIVEEFLETFRPGLFLLDPVMGDHGRAYATITREHCLRMKQLIRYADILTPNITEACLLTDTAYQEGPWTEDSLHRLCSKLSRLCPGQIVITGLSDGSFYQNYIWKNGGGSIYGCPSAGSSRPGTGDLFASILAADALYHRDFVRSVKKAADFTALCIRGSEKAGVPIKEGVIFEKYLGKLICQNRLKRCP